MPPCLHCLDQMLEQPNLVKAGARILVTFIGSRRLFCALQLLNMYIFCHSIWARMPCKCKRGGHCHTENDSKIKRSRCNGGSQKDMEQMRDVINSWTNKRTPAR